MNINCGKSYEIYASFCAFKRSYSQCEDLLWTGEAAHLMSENVDSHRRTRPLGQGQISGIDVKITDKAETS